MELRSWLPILVLLVTPVVAFADETPDAGPVDGDPPSGLVVVVNPVTGDLVLNPTPEQIGAVRSAPRAQRLSRSTEGLVPFALSGGGRGVYLDGRFQSSLVLEVGPDGAMSLRCVHESPDSVQLGDTPRPQPTVADR